MVVSALVKLRFLPGLGAILLTTFSVVVDCMADNPPTIIFYAQPSYVFLQGQVREGKVRIPPGPMLTAGQAIQSDGGLKDSADAGNIEIRRRFADGGMVCLRVDLADIGSLRRDPLLQNGDIIFVPTNTKNTPAPSH
jgi:protein involved in polysaccharide export with SLBB domain